MIFFYFGLVERQPNMNQKRTSGCFLTSVWLKGNQPQTKNEPVFGFGLVEWLFFGFDLVERQPYPDKKQSSGWFFSLVWLSGCFLVLV